MLFTSKSAAVALLALASYVSATPVELMERQSTVKIMPFGDSITGGPVGSSIQHRFDRLTSQGCWRSYLWQKLQDANIKNVDFVGTLVGSNCGLTHDRDNEGHVCSPGTC